MFHTNHYSCIIWFDKKHCPNWRTMIPQSHMSTIHILSEFNQCPLGSRKAHLLTHTSSIRIKGWTFLLQSIMNISQSNIYICIYKVLRICLIIKYSLLSCLFKCGFIIRWKNVNFKKSKKQLSRYSQHDFKTTHNTNSLKKKVLQLTWFFPPNILVDQM